MRFHRFPAAGCAAAALALGAAAAPSAAASTVSAPMIHESFTLLPCPGKPATTLQLEGCAEHRVVALDTAIDALNAKAFAKLGEAGRKTFVSASSAWLLYRDEACTAQASIYRGGSIQPVAYASCLLSLDRSHANELKTMLVALGPAG